jgi:hypothetical protein
MWVSQTYLTNLRADGAAVAYFLYESYRDDHARLERQIRPKLGGLAMSFGDDAHVFVPSEDQRESISREFTKWIAQRGLNGIELPGVLVLEYAMGDERSNEGSAAFISFAPLLEHPERTDAILDKLQQAFIALRDEIQRTESGLERALRNIQVRPSLWGLGYDFKPHLIDLIRRFRRD